MCNSIRSIQGELISRAVSSLYKRACTSPDPDVSAILAETLGREGPGPGREALKIELQNFRAAAETGLPICQDTGTAVVFIELGNRVLIEGGMLNDLVNDGVRRACRDSYLRPSQVYPPHSGRVNTMDNAPAVTHLELTQGNQIKISLMAKGAGCENVSKSEMLPPLAGEDGIRDLAVRCMLSGASMACPPVFLGIGIGGTLEVSGILAKKSLLRKPGVKNPDTELSALEERITAGMNCLNIGPQGFGGACTVLETRILTLPCHMASLPVTVCVECHAHRTASCVI